MKPTFSIQKCIKERSDRESWAEWSKTSEPSFTPLKRPINHSSALQKGSIGWLNFYRGIIKFTLEFRP